MDRFADSNFDKQNIYEIYRACRLCGAGAGYKMPIIQNVVDLVGRDVELKQKIRECVQIEVSNDDKMPPLICELCVDKVNDFYEFLEMCRQTNRRTRHRLGLPPQTLQRGAADSGDCILGITEPVYVKDNPEESVSRNKSKSQKGKVKKESEVKIKMEPEILDDRRSRRTSSPVFKRRTRNSWPSPPPAKDRRHSDTAKKAPAPLKSILKKEKDVKVENDLPRSKRSREKESHQELPAKKVKIAPKPITKPPKPTPKPSPKPPPKPITKLKPSKPQHSCEVCGSEFKSSQSLAAHQKVHARRSVNISKSNVTKQQKNNNCSPKESKSPPSTQSDNKCDKCERVYSTYRNLIRHQKTCAGKKGWILCQPKKRCSEQMVHLMFSDPVAHRHITPKRCMFQPWYLDKKASQAVIDPAILRSLRRVQIRVARCDSLLDSTDSCRITHLDKNYGLDRNCDYPYISSVRSLNIKSELTDGMVAIGEEIRREFEEGAFVHWDSDDSDNEEVLSHSPESLSNLTLKTIYSERFLGKVPRKRRRIKMEDSAIDMVEEFDDDLENNESVREKVASFDDLLREEIEKDEIEENRVEVNEKEEDCAVVDKNVGSDVDLGTSDVGTNESTNVKSDLNSECKKKANIESDNSKSNIFDNVRDIIVNNDEVASKSSLNISKDNEKVVVAEENVDTEGQIIQKEVKEDTVNDDDISKELNGEIENEEKVAQIVKKSNEVSPEEKAGTESAGNTDEVASDITIEEKENGHSDKNSEINDELEKELLQEEIGNDTQISDKQNVDVISKDSHDENNGGVEKDLQRKDKQNDVQIENHTLSKGEEFVSNTEECGIQGISNGISDAKYQEDNEENKLENMEIGTDDTIQVKEYTTPTSEESRQSLNGEADFTEEMDRKLMEELDAQIGECEGDGDSACDRDKITLADLLPDKAHERLDLDSIADDFNFDP